MRSYAAAQLKTTQLTTRNVNLYGLTFEQVTNQLALDKALLGRLTMQHPKFVPGHYVDAALSVMLNGLDPYGTDAESMETEKDIVFALGEEGLKYREFIAGNRETAAMPNRRPVCPLSTAVNAMVSRMGDILRAMPDVSVRPYEIISACLARFVESLPNETERLEGFFMAHVETTVQ